ncbi:MAG: ABC transporter permease [Deltaproteobacteria bacterium]|jgi:peptide/nickel transport system permease protein|nr:ABC transporter permease [Deltaproteobacteria bacterium]MBT7202056.1 ABC transporter permease [Deltaproteobacteria bacterium]
MGLLIFLVKRILASIPLLIGISFVSFLIIFAVPGDYVDVWLNQTVARTGQSRVELEPIAAALRAQYGFDQPFIIQYWTWIKGVITEFNFGPSFSQSRPVSEVIGMRFPRTIGLALITLICGQLIGAILGVYAALNQYKIGDTLATIFAFTGIVIPKFVVALVILYLLAFVWHSPYIGAIQSPQFMLQDHWDWPRLLDFLKHVWPILFISIWAGQGYILRMMRGNLLDVMKMQYIETARAKGLSKRRILIMHAIPNALHPIIMNQGARFDYMVKGELEIAIVLGIPTLGPLILSSVYSKDMYVVSAIFMLVAVLLIVGNLVADLLLALLDPRVRHATMESAT